MAQLLSRQGFNYIKKTELLEGKKNLPRDVILLDTIGELSKSYSIGTVIFVGGSLVPIGGHNVLEPVSHKKAVIFGPFMENFSEISKGLRESGGGIQVHTKEEFFFHAKLLLQDDTIRDTLGKKAFQIISLNQGAINKAMDTIEQFIQ